MATPITASALITALENEGVTYEEVRDWRNHNRNHKGPWGPVHGVMIHHTVTSGADETVDICLRRPRPICRVRCATASSPRTARCISSATAAPTTRASVTTTYCAR